MGNASSTEQQQQNGNHHTLNPLARPRSHAGASTGSSSKSSSSHPHHPLSQTSSAHGRSSPSWSRHGSMRRGSSHTPSPTQQQIKNAFFRDTSTPSTAEPSSAGGSLRRPSGRRSRAGSVNVSLQSQTTTNTPSRHVSTTGEADDPTTPTASRDRDKATAMASLSLDSRHIASTSSPTKSSSKSPDGRAAPPPSLGSSIFRRSSKFDASRHHKDAADAQGDNNDQSSNGSAPTTPLVSQQPPFAAAPSWQASLGAHSIVSPHPSPSIATDARHASGTTTYSNVDASGKAASPQTVPPPSAHTSSNRPFGRGIAAIFGTTGHSLGSTAAASMATSTTTDRSFSPTGHESSDGDRDDGGAASSSGPASPLDQDHGGGNTGSTGSAVSAATRSIAGATDELGRQVAAAFPSYLKIPTLIPSKQEQPLQPSLSMPGSPSGSAPSSGNVTPASSGWSGVAATAAKTTGAVLTPEEVVIAPGDASRVSSPSVEDLPSVSGEAETEGEPVPVATPALISHTDGVLPREEGDSDGEHLHDTDEKRKSTDTVSAPNQTSLSRTPTPTQKSHHATKALTPARLMVDRAGHTRAPSSETETSSEHMRRVQVATGIASGAATPVMPIPPGLTSAPPSAVSPAVSRGHVTPDRQSSELQINPDGSTVTSASIATTSAQEDHSSTKTPTDSPSGVGTTTASTPKSRPPPSHLTPYYYRNAKGPISLMPIVITWRGGGKEVFVTGTFANEWRSKILLKRSSQSGNNTESTRRANAAVKEEHSVVLHLPPGTHRMKFIVDDRWRVSRELPTASDGDGNLVNYLEIPNVGPAHSGPLSAPGEDLIDGQERKREREVEKIKEAERAARKRPSSRGGSEAAAATGTAVVTSAAQPDGTAEASDTQSVRPSTGATSEDAKLSEGARRKGILDLREEARRAELLKTGQLEEAFGVDEDALRAAETWVQEIPDSVIKAHYLEEQYQDELERNGGHHHHHEQQQGPAPPPSLPRQLEKVILNSSPANPALAPPGGTVDDNSILPAPNHVVLNHLTASAIKGGVLAVGTTTRYKRKYVTTVFYKPVQT